jgi:hypothetical protein
MLTVVILSEAKERVSPSLRSRRAITGSIREALSAGKINAAADTAKSTAATLR